ncbi:MAG: PBP1A family penicillin-binding protein, partial [Chitinispirillales bacterium]|nr:PBP1A family penicillin-binding protein [Chitinispirillales bacterium]
MQKKNGSIQNSEPGGVAGEAKPAGRKFSLGKVKGWPLFILFLIAIPAASFSLAAGSVFLYRLYETLPMHSQLQNVEQSVVSKVLDKDGKLIHEFSVERRFWVPLDKIPVELQNAVIAIEDRRFYSHWGINMQRNIGAALANVTRGKLAQGGSTVTQQLARNLYLSSDKTFIRKVREILTAVQLERNYTKREIMELYLNQAYLGAGVYGVQAAAEHYFSKNASELTLNECAVIAGIIQLPEHYRPDKADNANRVAARRNAVLRAMAAAKFIDKNIARIASDDPVVANPKVYGPPKAPYFMEMVRKHVSDKYGDEQLYNGGLVIHTTLDPVAQDSTEKSAERAVESLQKRLNRIFLDGSRADRARGISRDAFLANFDSLYALNAAEYAQLHDTLRYRRAQIAVVALETHTGAILALVGGRDFQESKFNRATQAKRQPGSLFKPYVYAAAMDNGLSPATVILDQPITLVTPDGEWRPENYDRKFLGPLSVRDALARSNNLVAIQVFNRVGGQTVVDEAYSLGIKQKLQPVPSLAIGSCEVTPMEIISSYSVFPNRGIQAEPYFIEKITDKNGRVLEKAAAKERQAITPQTAFLMSSMLNSVVCCGTAASIYGLGFRRPAGGKTGTTNDYTDAWFIGFTPQVTCGVWTGVDERRSLGYGVTGSLAAIPVWVDAMKALHNGRPVQDFSRPIGIKSLNICAQSFGLAGGACPKTKVEHFTYETEVAPCNVHGVARGLRSGDEMDIFGPSR